VLLALGMEGNDGNSSNDTNARWKQASVQPGGYSSVPLPETVQGGTGRVLQQHLGEFLDAPPPSPAAIPTPTVLVQEPAEAIDGMAGLGEGADGQDSSGPADSVEQSARRAGDEQRDSGANTGAGEDVAALICSYPWNCPTAIRVFTCESGLRADAISWNGTSYGIAQVWQGHAYRWPNFWQDWSNPEVNIAWAFELWSEQGWGAWDCR